MDNDLILDRYRPIATAGSGGFATVLVAYDTRIQRRVAIKQMQLEANVFDVGGYDESMLPGLEEARTAAMLSAPNIVGVLDFEVRDGMAYLIMEFVDGITLTQLIANHNQDVNADIVAAVFQSVAHAIQVAHDNQVLHLDIKPDNIIINRQGEVKVTDFGLAKLSDAAGFGHAGGGTIGYMPLEQMRQEPLDVRCDEWALASITYEMIYGSNPFIASDLASAERVIQNAELVLPHLCMDGIDEEADDVLFYGLDPDREERYASVHDFADELQPLLGSPARGKKLLARIAGQASEDIPEEPMPDHAQSRQTARKPLNVYRLVMRVWAAISAFVLAGATVPHITWFNLIDGGRAGLWPAGVAVAVIVVLAVFFPGVGIALALLGFALALASAGLYIPAVVLLVADVAWWAFIGRRGMEQPNCAAAPALLGLAGASNIAPLVSGYFLSVKETLGNIAFTAVVAVFLGALHSVSVTGWRPLSTLTGAIPAGFQESLILMLASPEVWITLGSWLVAAIIMSALCSYGKRVLGMVGALLAGAVVVAGLVAISWVTSGGVSFVPRTVPLAIAVGGAVLAMVLCAVRPPDAD